MPMPLAQLVYTSRAATVMTADQLGQLAAQSERKNASLGVTGMLLYGSGHFMQVLEGDIFTVHSLFARIATDFRHRNVVRLFFGPLAERRFSRWSMGLVNLDRRGMVDPAISEGVVEVVQCCEALSNPVDAVALLRSFRDTVSRAA
jgi:hypothetical protein